MRKFIMLIWLLFPALSFGLNNIEGIDKCDGSIDNPYLVYDNEDLLAIMNNPELWDKHFIQEKDISFQDIASLYDLSPIGNINQAFTGSYDGNFHKISNLSMDCPDLEGVGLFGVLSGDSTKICNLGLNNCNVKGKKSVGGLVGIIEENSEVSNCFTSGVVTSSEDNNIGGLIGKVTSRASVNKCFSKAYVYSHNKNIGGLVGLCEENAIITNCYALGSVLGQERVGGLVGRNREDSRISSCYSIGSVSSYSDDYVNGLVGRNQAIVENSYFDVNTSNCCNNNAGIGLTTDLLKESLSYNNWDFDNTWRLDLDINEGYPSLTWQEEGALPNLPENGLLAPVVFSHEAGFYNDEFELELSHSNTSGFIIYTIDGSEPDIKNINGSTYRYKKFYPRFPEDDFGEFFENQINSDIYVNPIPIYNRSFEDDKLSQIPSNFYNYDWEIPNQPSEKGIVVKAKVYYSDNLQSETITNTYFVGLDRIEDSDLPVISISLDEDGLFDYDEGIYVPGQYFDNWRICCPDNTASNWTYANYHLTGENSERKAYFEYFDNDSNRADLSQYIGLRLHGGASRAFNQKSLRLYSRGDYGQSKFDYKLFDELDDCSFDKVILRNSGSDYCRAFLRDPLVHKITRHSGIDSQAYQPIILFINGEYWGLHNMRERIDCDYLARKYDINPNNIDLISRRNENVAGTLSAWNDLLEYLRANTLEGREEYEHVANLVDIDNYTKYFITEIFIDNTDWPWNNVKCWRVNNMAEGDDNNPYNDGRWRWLLFDTDYAYGLCEGNEAISNTTLGNTLQWDYDDSWENLLIRRLLTNHIYRDYFINTFADMMNTTFDGQRSEAILNEMHDNIIAEIPYQSQRWGRLASVSSWESKIDVIRYFLNHRRDEQFQQLVDYFQLDGIYDLDIYVSDTQQGYVTVNDNNILDSILDERNRSIEWHGSYFNNKTITIEAIPNEGYKFSHWNDEQDSLATKVIHPNDDVHLEAHFELIQTDRIKDIEAVTLSKAYPNPFRSKTKIDFYSPNHNSNLKIYNIRGELVKEFKSHEKGNSSIIWDGTNNNNKEVASGVYLYRLDNSAGNKTNKVLYIK